ncbi:uncharacterized protein BDV17DRAFT_275090 [Aspergillus undulatus]|uniref:uncharacterized protein n=1 Tax=Aspergillus undulatus TaxID=1810928 RepID=UPI003CCCFF2C
MGLEELVRFYTGCRKFPRHNLPELAEGLKRKISPNPYDKRNDTELSRLMQCFSVKAESTTFVEPPKESESEAKLVAITKTVRPFIPRPDIFTGARYLPKLPKPVSVDQRREWSIKSKSWSLGPGLRKKPSNKIVRFAEQVEYEPEQTTKTWEQEQEQVTEPSRTAPGWSFNWSHLIIAFLLFLLLVSNMAPEEPKVSWKEANTRPDEIVAKLRSAGQSSPHPVIIDFEVGRWSDVDPSIYG